MIDFPNCERHQHPKVSLWENPKVPRAKSKKILESELIERPLAIDQQSQIASLLLVWLGFAIRVDQAVSGLARQSQPSLAPIGLNGLKKLIDSSVPESLSSKKTNVRGELYAAVDHVLGNVPNGENAKASWASRHFHRLLWFGAALINSAFNSEKLDWAKGNEILAKIEFESDEGLFFPDILDTFPLTSKYTATTNAILSYLQSFYNSGFGRGEVRQASDRLVSNLYDRINRCKRIEDPFPDLFQRVSIRTAIFGFNYANASSKSALYLIVREGRSPNSPNWNAGHQLIRDLLYVRSAASEGNGQSLIKKAFYYSANDELVYELRQSIEPGANNFIRLDGAKVKGNVREFDYSRVESQKFLTLCLNKNLLASECEGVLDSLLFAQRGKDMLPGAWLVLSCRCFEDHNSAIEISLRQRIDPKSAISWLKKEKVIGAFTHGTAYDRGLAVFLNRTSFANRTESQEALSGDTKRVVGRLNQHFDFSGSTPQSDTGPTQFEISAAVGVVAEKLVTSHQKHSSRVSPRSIILEAANEQPSQKTSTEGLLKKYLFSLDLDLSPKTFL